MNEPAESTIRFHLAITTCYLGYGALLYGRADDRSTIELYYLSEYALTLNRIATCNGGNDDH
jgi:hypothetical protein